MVGMSDAVLVGPVSTRKGYRLHLAESGRAHCGAGTGKILGAGEPLHAKHADRICRRCIKAIRTTVENAQHEATSAARNRYRESEVHALGELADALRTPAERRRLDALAARLRADLEARYAARPLALAA
jgi:hypothetical protein